MRDQLMTITLLLPRGKWHLRALGLVSYEYIIMMQGNATLAIMRLAKMED